MGAVTDPNVVAVERAGLDEAHARWLEDVAGYVDGRLDSVRDDWRDLAEAEALRAATFGLLLALLALRYPDTRDVLSRAAEAHPSFGTFPATQRLKALEQLCRSEELVTEWIGPLLEIDDHSRLGPLCVFGEV